MVKFKSLLIGILTLAVIVLVSSCSKDDNPTSSNSGNELVGTWSLTKVIIPDLGNIELSPQTIGLSATFVIRSDKSFTITLTDSSGSDVTTGTWTASNGTASLTNSADGTVVTMPYTVSGNTLTVETVYDLTEYGFGAEQKVKLVLTKQ